MTVSASDESRSIVSTARYPPAENPVRIVRAASSVALYSARIQGTSSSKIQSLYRPRFELSPQLPRRSSSGVVGRSRPRPPSDRSGPANLMRAAGALLVLMLVLTAPADSWARERIDPPALRLLFVGNSLVYVGNLPAVFDALARRNGRSVQSDMLVKGGATLSDRLEDGSVESALGEGSTFAFDLPRQRPVGG